MTPKELDRLEKLAKAATPGIWRKDCPAWAKPWMVGLRLPWSDESQRDVICTLDVRYGNTDDAPRALDADFDQVVADAEFIAGANPQTVLRLIKVIRKLRALAN